MNRKPMWLASLHNLKSIEVLSRIKSLCINFSERIIQTSFGWLLKQAFVNLGDLRTFRTPTPAFTSKYLSEKQENDPYNPRYDQFYRLGVGLWRNHNKFSMWNCSSLIHRLGAPGYMREWDRKKADWSAAASFPARVRKSARRGVRKGEGERGRCRAEKPPGPERAGGRALPPSTYTADRSFMMQITAHGIHFIEMLNIRQCLPWEWWTMNKSRRGRFPMMRANHCKLPLLGEHVNGRETPAGFHRHVFNVQLLFWQSSGVWSAEGSTIFDSHWWERVGGVLSASFSRQSAKSKSQREPVQSVRVLVGRVKRVDITVSRWVLAIVTDDGRGLLFS